jgi:hypothetical protein
VRFTQDDDVIQAFAPYASKKALAPGIHERRLHCRSHDVHSSTLRHSVEFSAELAVVIANDHIGTLTERCDILRAASASPRERINLGAVERIEMKSIT